MDRTRTPTPLHTEPGGVIIDLKKRRGNLNQEGGPPVLRGGLLVIHLLPNVAGSAADRSTFFLLNCVVGDGPRAHSNSTSRRAGRDNYRFFTKKKRTSNQEGGPRVPRSRLLIIHPPPNVTGSAADRATFFSLNGVIGDGPCASPSQLHADAEPGGGMAFDLIKRKGFQSRRRTSGAQKRTSDHSPPAKCGWQRRG